MTGQRSYGDPCGIARALDVVGERWALLVARELLYGPKRFSDLRGSLGASPNVLSQRLAELEESGVVERRSGGGALYALTDWGQELHSILLQLERWGSKTAHRPRGELTADALMAALEARFQPGKASGSNATIELRLGEERYSADVEGGMLSISRALRRNPDAIIETTMDTLGAIVLGKTDVSEALVEISGSGLLARMFLKSFEGPR